MTWQTQLEALLARAAARGPDILVMTGAGISAESGIPTFRGPEGYWTVGSSVYQPQELATRAAFSRMPFDIWRWYLHRRKVCRSAAPNPAHRALVNLEKKLAGNFCLITQNVDGLHRRAGNSAERTLEIHGNIDFMRCAAACTTALSPIPDVVTDVETELRCSACKGLARPHVLWFDEYYDEVLFRFESSLARAEHAALVITVGSSGTTNLPNLVVQSAARAGAQFIDINPDDNPFREHARANHGLVIADTAARALPIVVEAVGCRAQTGPAAE